MPDRTQTIAYPAPGSRPSRRDTEPLAPHVIVLFGATGDLAKRKLLPRLAYLQQSKSAPDVRIIGSATEDLTTDEFRERARQAVETYGTHRMSDDEWEQFASRLDYVSVSAGPKALAETVHAAEELLGEGVCRLHYLSVPPKA